MPAARCTILIVRRGRAGPLEFPPARALMLGSLLAHRAQMLVSVCLCACVCVRAHARMHACMWLWLNVDTRAP